MAVSGMRGLSVFVSDVRNCQNKEQERLRVEKELANIRTHFKSEKALSAYEKKKYVWKLLYIYMLGYDVDFGHMEAVALISAHKYAEKQVGYIVTSCLLNENHDFLRIVINTVRNDIIGRNETFQCLALTMVGNVGGKEFAESLATDVQKLLTSAHVRPLVKKKAALCLLRLFRKNPDVINTEGWPEQMAVLLEEKNLGVLVAVMSLMVALVSSSPHRYVNCMPRLVRILERLTRLQDVPQEYTYYAIPSPWLQVKVMRALQYLAGDEEGSSRKPLFDVLSRILQNTDVVKNVNKNNAAHAVLFEAIALAIHLDAERELLAQCVGLLGKFISVREPNIRYLGLENMSRMLLVADVADSIRRHQAQIVVSLRDPDISIRRRALDLLYGMCDVSNAKDIVEELLQYLTTAEFGIREELTLKTAILAERFAPTYTWYVDVILELIEKAGDFVSDDVWHRVVHIVTNNSDIQAHAASTVLKQLSKQGSHETMVKVGGYLLGEFGHLISTQPSSSPMEIFLSLHDKFYSVSISTRALLLSAYVKILLKAAATPQASELQATILSVFSKQESSVDAEVQQRAVEYYGLAVRGAAMADIVGDMPAFPTRESALLKRADESHDGGAADVSAVRVKQQLGLSQALVLSSSSSAAGASLGPLMPPLSSSSNQSLPSDASPSLAPQDLPPSAVGQPPATASSLSAAAAGAATSSAPLADLISPTAVPASAAAPSTPSSDVAAMLGDLLLLEAPPPPPSSHQPPPPPHPSAAHAMPAISQSHPAAAAPGGAHFSSVSSLPSAAGQPSPSSMALAIVDPTAAAAASSVQPLGSVVEWVRALILKDSGVLYEDPNIQIGLKADWRPPHGRVVLFIGNKETAPLTNVRLSVAPTPGLRVMPAVPPTLIPPRAQVQVAIEVAAVLVPSAAPLASFFYSSPSGISVPVNLHLPFLLGKFLLPTPISGPDFFSHWKAAAAAPHKQQEVLRGVRPLELPAMAHLLSLLHIQEAPGVDPNPNNLAACATLLTETLPPILLLARIETDPADRTQLRLTVASQDANASTTFKEFIKEQLLEAPPHWLTATSMQPTATNGGF